MTEQGIENFVNLFVGILYEATPFIILGAIIAGLLEELVPQQFITRILPRSKLVAILIGGLLGLLFPMCECGIIPVMRRLLRKGVPLSCCICYMLAGPIINVVVMLSTYVAFSNMQSVGTASDDPAVRRQLGGVGMVCFRVGLGYLVAVGTSLIVERLHRREGNKLLLPHVVPQLQPTDQEEEAGPRKPLWQRLSNICETSLHDFVDITVFLILGAFLSATVRLVCPPETIAKISAIFPLAILLMMGMAIVLCLCSEADAFVAASFIALPPSAKIGFLVLGPMLDFKLYMMFLRVFSPRLMWTIIVSVFVQVFIYSNIVHLILQWLPDSFFEI